MNSCLLSLCLLGLWLAYVRGHAYLASPCARSSCWREGSVGSQTANKASNGFPVYQSDNEMNCGGAGRQWSTNGGKCSICGEDWSKSPKQFGRGDSLYTGQIARKYSAGEVFDAQVVITANHLGWHEFRLCCLDGWSGDADQACLDRILIANQTGHTRFPVKDGWGAQTIKLVMPSGFQCNHAVFQVNSI